MIHRKQILDIKYLSLTISYHSRKIKCLKRKSIKTGQKKCKETFDKILRHIQTIFRLLETQTNYFQIRQILLQEILSWKVHSICQLRNYSKDLLFELLKE